MIAFQDPLGQLPVPASTFAADVDGVYYFALYVTGFFFFLILGVLMFAVLKFRRKRPDQPAASSMTHNTPLEVAWTVIPLIIVMIMFAWGWKGSMDMTYAPADCLQYEAVGKQWEWQIKHPDSKSPTINEMWVPVDTNVKVTIYSRDVLHAFYIPAFRVKRDTLPGRNQMVWFNANKLSELDADGNTIPYQIYCAEYCGTNHSYMLAKVHVVTPEVFATKPWEIMPSDPWELGQWVYERRCYTCHTIDGNPSTGPSFQGLWGKTEALADGSSAEVDEAYIRESIQQPSAKIVKGYEGVNMTVFPDIAADDTQLAGLVEFLKDPNKATK